jgi:predicted metal-dependent HD superfamily phosphohydrolase
VLISVSDLEGRFLASTRALGARPARGLAPLFAALEAAYNEPHRAYHSLEHIAETLALLDEYVQHTPAEAYLSELEAQEVVVALFYHDAVYDPKAPDNEEQSAELCRSHLEAVEVAAEERERIARLVLATKHLGRVDAERPGTAHAEAVIRDIDLSILGKPRDRYRRYIAGVRKEYRHLSDRAFREGRLRVVAHFLSLPRLYRTSYFFERFEAPARGNLADELAAIETERV